MLSSDLYSEKPESTLPDSWQWITELVDEAHLPSLGLPVRWEITAEKRKRIAFDPASLICTEIETNQSKKHKSSPIGFIDGTRGKQLMPGTNTPAAARLTRYLEPRFSEYLVSDAKGDALAPCLACGDYVSVTSLALDHAQAKDEIQKRQADFIDRLNQDPAFARVVMNLEGISKFFVNVEGRYYGTLFFYDLYFNDIDNLWLICSACNLHKSDQEVLSWFQEQWLYGDEFLNYLGRVKDDSPILLKTQHRQGLAEAAIEWYWDRHTNYASIAKKLMQDVVTPIQLLNQRVDRVVGLVRAGGDERRLQRHAASLDFRLALLAEIANMTGIDMPKRESESSHTSSEGDVYLKDTSGNRLNVDLPIYRESAAEVVLGSAQAIRSMLEEKAQRKMEEKKAESVTKVNLG